MEKHFTSYSETIKYSKENPANDLIYYYGAQLWERKSAWDYLKLQLKPEGQVETYEFTSYSGTDKYDLIYRKNKINRVVEIKFRYCNSDDYSSAICEIDKFNALNNEAIKRNAIAEYWNIYLDGVIKIYDFRYVVKQEVNFSRSASDSYNTNNKKNYPCFLLTEDDLYTYKFKDKFTIDEINNFAKKELIKRGFEVPDNFKINK